jgi:hypothetical protein
MCPTCTMPHESEVEHFILPLNEVDNLLDATCVNPCLHGQEYRISSECCQAFCGVTGCLF